MVEQYPGRRLCEEWTASWDRLRGVDYGLEKLVDSSDTRQDTDDFDHIVGGCMCGLVDID